MKSLSHVRFFVIPWTVTYQAPPSMGFSRQEYWSELPFPSPGVLPDPDIEPLSSALQADSLPSEPTGTQKGHVASPSEDQVAVSHMTGGSAQHHANKDAKSLQFCPTLCNPGDCSALGCSVRGILRQGCWSGLPCPSPEESSQSRDQTCVTCISFIGRQVLYH